MEALIAFLVVSLVVNFCLVVVLKTEIDTDETETYVRRWADKSFEASDLRSELEKWRMMAAKHTGSNVYWGSQYIGCSRNHHTFFPERRSVCKGSEVLN